MARISSSTWITSYLRKKKSELLLPASHVAIISYRKLNSKSSNASKTKSTGQKVSPKVVTPIHLKMSYQTNKWSSYFPNQRLQKNKNSFFNNKKKTERKKRKKKSWDRNFSPRKQISSKAITPTTKLNAGNLLSPRSFLGLNFQTSGMNQRVMCLNLKWWMLQFKLMHLSSWIWRHIFSRSSHFKMVSLAPTTT